ncbi:hypothetical protein, partial [Streptomyces mirabilis]|uniref:hypothetical protein n=1 Tax=Streptomyces mirabilis TaxID=68239 RepID=UPI00364B0412
GHKTPDASLNPSETMPDQQESRDHVRLRYGFSDQTHIPKPGTHTPTIEALAPVNRTNTPN